MGLTHKEIADQATRAAKRKDMFGRVFKWLVGGGILVVISVSITFGISKERMSNELLLNRDEHTEIQKRLDSQSTKLERLPVMENDIKWLRTELMRSRVAKPVVPKLEIPK